MTRAVALTLLAIVVLELWTARRSKAAPVTPERTCPEWCCQTLVFEDQP